MCVRVCGIPGCTTQTKISYSDYHENKFALYFFLTKMIQNSALNYDYWFNQDFINLNTLFIWFMQFIYFIWFSKSKIWLVRFCLTIYAILLRWDVFDSSYSFMQFTRIIFIFLICSSCELYKLIHLTHLIHN